MTEPRQKRGRLEWVSLNDNTFAPTPYPERTGMDVTELTSSVRIHGVLSPILCRSTAEGLQVVCGSKRLQAAFAAKIDAIPVFIRDLTDAEAIRCYLSTKVHRGALRDEDQQGALEQLRQLRASPVGSRRPTGPGRPTTDITGERSDRASRSRGTGRLTGVEGFTNPATVNADPIVEICHDTQVFFDTIRAQRFIRADTAEALVDRIFELKQEDAKFGTEEIYGHLSGEVVAPHSLLCTSLGIEVANALGWKPGLVRRLALGALLHDVGMVFIEHYGLHSPNPLTRQQRDALPRHTRIGEALIETTETWHREVALCARDHHERFGGTGYPAEKKGEEVCRSVRLLACVDAYAALVSPRPHRPAFTPEVALCRLEKAGDLGLFDPTLLSSVVGEIRCRMLNRTSDRTEHVPTDKISIELAATPATMPSKGV